MSIREEIAGKLRAAIAEGRKGFRPGDPLPAMKDVPDVLGIPAAAGTVQRVYEELSSEGLIVREGRGYVVRGPVAPLQQIAFGPIGHAGAAWAEDMLAIGRRAGTDLLGVTYPSRIPAPVVEAFDITGDPAGQVVLRHHLNRVDGQPKQIEDIYIPASIAQGTNLTKPTDIDLTAEFRLQDIELEAPREMVTARSATDEEAAALNLTRRTTVQEIIRLDVVADDSVPMVTVLIYAAGSIVRRYQR